MRLRWAGSVIRYSDRRRKHATHRFRTVRPFQRPSPDCHQNTPTKHPAEAPSQLCRKGRGKTFCGQAFKRGHRPCPSMRSTLRKGITWLGVQEEEEEAEEEEED